MEAHIAKVSPTKSSHNLDKANLIKIRPTKVISLITLLHLHYYAPILNLLFASEYHRSATYQKAQRYIFLSAAIHVHTTLTVFEGFLKPSYLNYSKNITYARLSSISTKHNNLNPKIEFIVAARDFKIHPYLKKLSYLITF